MCVICVKKAGVALPTEEIFEECFSANNDGAGFAFLTSTKTIHTIKGLMTYTAFRAALEAVLSTIDGQATPMLFHFRIGTHGSKDCPAHTHPFPLADNYPDMEKLEYDADTVIAHNGIASFHKLVGGTRSYTSENNGPSDTMELIANVFHPIMSLNPAALDSKAIQNIILSILGYNKIAILDKSGSFRLFGDFVEDAGILYSNKSYNPVVETKKTYPTYKSGYDYSNLGLDDDGYDRPIDNKKRPLLDYNAGYTAYRAGNDSVEKYLRSYNDAVCLREKVIGAKWRGKDSDYDKIIKDGYYTYYWPVEVDIAPTASKKSYSLPILSPMTPWYCNHENRKLYFLSIVTGVMAEIGEIESWQRLSMAEIGSKIIGFQSSDFRLWNKKDVTYRQGVWPYGND
jgi:hypothetical protein